MSSRSVPPASRLAELAACFSGKRVLVVGDLIADEFVYGEIARVSREAPVMILRYESTVTVPGGAGNAAANAAALGGRAALAGLVGRDRPGRQAVKALVDRGVDVGGLAGERRRATPTKTRLLAGLVHSLRQQVIRIDNEPRSEPSTDALDRVAATVRERAATTDAIVISDYNYGTVAPVVVDAVRDATSSRGVPVVVDSRFRLGDFTGFTSATPNEVELEAYAGVVFDTDSAVAAAAEAARHALGATALLVTRGSRGMALAENGEEPCVFPTVGSAPALDVTGAGDTVIATYALGLACGASFLEAAHLANHAGGIVVMKRGTATVSLEELLASVEA